MLRLVPCIVSIPFYGIRNTTHAYRNATHTYRKIIHPYRKCTHTYNTIIDACRKCSHTYSNIIHAYRNATHTYRKIIHACRNSTYSNKFHIYLNCRTLLLYTKYSKYSFIPTILPDPGCGIGWLPKYVRNQHL